MWHGKKKKRERERSKYTNDKFWQGYDIMKHLYTVGGNINWHSHSGKQYGGFSKD